MGAGTQLHGQRQKLVCVKTLILTDGLMVSFGRTQPSRILNVYSDKIGLVTSEDGRLEVAQAMAGLWHAINGRNMHCS